MSFGSGLLIVKGLGQERGWGGMGGGCWGYGGTREARPPWDVVAEGVFWKAGAGNLSM